LVDEKRKKPKNKKGQRKTAPLKEKKTQTNDRVFINKRRSGVIYVFCVLTIDYSSEYDSE